jgi:hypothetical protein
MPRTWLVGETSDTSAQRTQTGRQSLKAIDVQKRLAVFRDQRLNLWDPCHSLLSPTSNVVPRFRPEARRIEDYDERRAKQLDRRGREGWIARPTQSELRLWKYSWPICSVTK